MRLLNVHTRHLSEFFGSQTPPYAILSHCWGSEEVNYREMTSTPTPPISPSESEFVNKAGYEKIHSSCLQSIEDGLDWLWVDTCCIDKSSSAELSEAINSMYNWYENSVVCYALLEETTRAVYQLSDV